VLELCIPILAIFGLVKLFNAYDKEEDKLKALKFTLFITAGISVIFLLGKAIGVFDFVGANDAYYRQEAGLEFVDAVRRDRAMLFTQDTLRTLVLVLLSAGTIFLFLKKKLNETKVVLIFAALIIFDLVGVDRRYVNTDNFVSSRQVEAPYNASPADLEIQKDKSHFRVFDVTSGGARTSYFHNSLTGYHAAKLKRFDDLFNFYIARNNINVLNMLNTKYIITTDEKGQPYSLVNDRANGNAWFVGALELVKDSNEEIQALAELDNKNKAVYTKPETVKGKTLSNTYTVDSIASIQIIDYKPNAITYQSKNTNDGFAVFSEVYYGNGWQAYINDEAVPHYRVNYALRGLNIPKGNNSITFKFEAQVVKTGSKIALISSIILGLLLIAGVVLVFKRKTLETA
jgi:hypothetical protein